MHETVVHPVQRTIFCLTGKYIRANYRCLVTAGRAGLSKLCVSGGARRAAGRGRGSPGARDVAAPGHGRGRADGDAPRRALQPRQCTQQTRRGRRRSVTVCAGAGQGKTLHEPRVSTRR